MIPFSTAISSGFTWTDLARNRGCELKLNDEVVGTLRRSVIFSSDYLAETSDGNWTFQRSGFLGTGAEIVDSASQQQIATFKSKWSGRGMLTFAGGQTFHLECKGLARPVWRVTTESGKPVLSLHTREKIVNLPVDTGAPAGRLPLLIMFTLYRVRQAEEDAASAAMVS